MKPDIDFILNELDKGHAVAVCEPLSDAFFESPRKGIYTVYFQPFGNTEKWEVTAKQVRDIIQEMNVVAVYTEQDKQKETKQ